MIKALIAYCCLANFLAAAEKPNVILILADDLGYQGLSCYGSEIVRTPNIDRLATGGQMWSQAYAGMATCAPSRAVLMSGQYTPRTGIFRVVDRYKGNEDHIRYLVPPLAKGLAVEKVTLGEAFQAAGYTTGMFGKWHLGRGAMHPSNQGFDQAIESHSSHFNFKLDPESGEKIPEGTYLGDYLTDRSLEFMESCRKSDKPFFLYLPHFLVHKPLQSKEDLKAKYQKLLGKDYGPEVIELAAMTESLDESVGRIYQYLKDRDLLEQTLIVFTSDNGAYSLKGEAVNLLNRPLRESKGSLYEGGIRVPLIFHWPGKIGAGSSAEVPLHFVDLYPTLLDLAGLDKPAGYLLDGNSLSSIVLSPKAKFKPRELFWFFPKYSQYKEGKGWKNEWRNVIRYGDLKLIEYVETDRFELFNLKEDPTESKDLAGSDPELMADMKARLEAGKKRYGAPVPVKNPDYVK